MPAIPHLSMAGVGDPGGLRRLAAEMAAAYTGVGFAYVTGHGIPAASIAALFDASRRFHALPQRAKDAIAVNRHHRGYIAPGAATDRASSVEAATRPNSERVLPETFRSAARPPGGLAARRPQPAARSGRFPRDRDGVRGRRRSRAPFWSIPAISCRSGAADAGGRRRTGSSTRRTGTAIRSPGSTTPRSTPGSRRSTVRPGTFHRCRRRSDMATMSWPRLDATYSYRRMQC